jgi:hypothetical protein
LWRRKSQCPPPLSTGTVSFHSGNCPDLTACVMGWFQASQVLGDQWVRICTSLGTQRQWLIACQPAESDLKIMLPCRVTPIVQTAALRLNDWDRGRRVFLRLGLLWALLLGLAIHILHGQASLTFARSYLLILLLSSHSSTITFVQSLMHQRNVALPSLQSQEIN